MDPVTSIYLPHFSTLSVRRVFNRNETDLDDKITEDSNRLRLIVKFIERAHNLFGDPAHHDDKKSIVYLSYFSPE